MHPIFFQIGPITVFSYGVSLAAAVLVCAWLLTRDTLKAGLPKDTAVDLVFWSVIGGIIGARIFYIIISWDFFVENPAEIIMINKGGLAWQGGFVGGLTGGLLFVKRQRLPFWLMLDLAAPYIALGQAIGRVGCFFKGCCYGRPWMHGIYFPVHHEKLHPTQLYETVMLLAIFFVLRFARKPSWPKGMLFALYLWLAAIERFTVEFFRADHDSLWWGLSLFQYIAIAIFIAGIVVFIRLRKE